MPPQTEFDAASAYRQFGAELYRFAFNALGDAHAAEDAIQETFTRAWRSGHRYSSERGSQRTWLYSIARNIIRDAFRRRHRVPDPVDVYQDQSGFLDHGPVHENSPHSRGAPGVAHSTHPTLTDDRLMLIEALSTLSMEHRQAVLAIHVIGVTYAELSESTRVSVSTLRSRTFHGLKALRRHINAVETAHE